MCRWIKHHQHRQEPYQQQLHCTIGGASCHPQKLAPYGLNPIPAELTRKPLLEALQLWLTCQHGLELADHHRNESTQLADLGDQLRHQQLDDQASAQEHGQQHHCESQWAWPSPSLQPLDRYIQCNGQYDGSKQHQQYPAQLPDEEGENHKGQADKQISGIHGGCSFIH